MFNTSYAYASYDEDKNLTYELVMPGREVEDFKVETLNNKLIITSGDFSDSYRLPQFVNKKKIKAKYKAGILIVTLPSNKEDRINEVKVETE